MGTIIHQPAGQVMAGHAIGILLLNTAYPIIPGNVANASTSCWATRRSSWSRSVVTGRSLSTAIGTVTVIAIWAETVRKTKYGNGIHRIQVGRPCTSR